MTTNNAMEDLMRLMAKVDGAKKVKDLIDYQKLDMNRPTNAGKAFMNSVTSPEGWKFPTSVFTTPDKADAEDCADAMDFYLGGHETTTEIFGNELHNWTVYHVYSLGYYHYIGS